MNALIPLGCKTTHGGTVTEANSSFLVDGKVVHLEGMSHYCPLCKNNKQSDFIRAMLYDGRHENNYYGK